MRQPWIDKVLHCLDECVEWQNPGILKYAVTEDGELIVAPARAEVVGGRHDGASVFVPFLLRVNDLTEVFDEQPWIFWNTDNTPALTLEGKIGGEPAMMMLMSDPFRDGEHDFRI